MVAIVKGAVQSLLVGMFEFLRFRLSGNWSSPPTIILTPGKEGSSSVYESVKAKGISNGYHIHYIDKTEIVKCMKNHWKSERKSIPRHLFTSWFCEKRLRGYTGRVHLILLVRNPIDRLVSSVYQNLNRNGITRSNIDEKQSEIESIVTSMMSQDYFNYLDNWFKREVEGYFGVDVFTLRHGLVKSGKFDVTGMCMRMEDLDDRFMKNYKEVFGSEVHLLRRNIGSNKFYNESYKRTKKSLSTKTSMGNALQSKYFDQFYSVDEAQPFFFHFGKSA